MSQTIIGLLAVMLPILGGTFGKKWIQAKQGLKYVQENYDAVLDKALQVRDFMTTVSKAIEDDKITQTEKADIVAKLNRLIINIDNEVGINNRRKDTTPRRWI